MNSEALNGLVILKYVCTGGDEISHYDTLQTTLAPLYKYLDEILATNEWGYVYVYNRDIYTKLEYTNHEYKNIPSVILNNFDKIVVEALYEGGWSRGDWRLQISDE